MKKITIAFVFLIKTLFSVAQQSPNLPPPPPAHKTSSGSQVAPNSDTTSLTVYTYVEQMPEFPGGQVELMKFLQKNLRYPPGAREHNMEGRVVVQFIVNEDGTLSGHTTIRSVEDGFDKEAMRVIKLMPNWIPGKANGNTVKVYIKLPVAFQLGSGDSDDIDGSSSDVGNTDSTEAPIAVVEGSSFSDVISSDVLHKAKALKIISKETGHVLPEYAIISYEVVYIRHRCEATVEKNEGGAIFTGRVIRMIRDCKSGDQIIFRSIRVKKAGLKNLSLDAVVLKVE